MTLLQDTLQTLQKRLKELEPAVQEHAELQAVIARIAPQKPSRRRTGRTGRSGSTQKAALKAITKSPGMSTSEVARAIGREPHYLYRVLPTLEAQGSIKRDGAKKWHPVGD